MDVSIIIVNYNTKELTRQCLRSIYDRTQGLRFEVFVVDNASADGSPATIRAEFPQVRLISNARNVGFGMANNVAIERAEGKYLFLLNSDTVLLNNVVKKFFDYAEDSPARIGVVGGWLEDANGVRSGSFGSFPSYVNLFRDYSHAMVRDVASTIGFLFGREDWHIVRRDGDRHGSTKVDWIVGADLFIPRYALETVGGFDSGYFLGAEEIDLQYRMRESGFARVLIEGPRIVHLEHRSSNMPVGFRAVFSRSVSMSNEGLILFMRKNRPSLLLFVLKLFIAVRYLNPFFVKDVAKNHCFAFMRR